MMSAMQKECKHSTLALFYIQHEVMDGVEPEVKLSSDLFSEIFFLFCRD